MASAEYRVARSQTACASGTAVRTPFDVDYPKVRDDPCAHSWQCAIFPLARLLLSGPGREKKHSGSQAE